MRIISKYRDYYDSIMRTGFDENIVFVREGAEDDPLPVMFTHNWRRVDVENTEKHASTIVSYINSSMVGGSGWLHRGKEPCLGSTAKYNIQRWFNGSKNYRNCKLEDIKGYVVGFCGKFYVIYEVIFWRGNSLKKFFIHDEDHPAFKENANPRPVIGEEPDMFKGNINHLFIDMGCPIFMIKINLLRYRLKESKITKNPILTDIDFQKVVDPYTAYQELSMFFGSVFANDEDNMVKISDVDKATSKGFDKWSFKNPPSKKRKTL